MKEIYKRLESVVKEANEINQAIYEGNSNYTRIEKELIFEALSNLESNLQNLNLLITSNDPNKITVERHNNFCKRCFGTGKEPSGKDSP